MSKCKHNTHRDPPCIWCANKVIAESQLFCIALGCKHNPKLKCKYEPKETE